MILQINKSRLIDEKTKKFDERLDLLDGVRRVNVMNNFVMVEFLNGDVFSYSCGSGDSSFQIETSSEMHDFLITGLWLLNDEGKTLKRLI